MDCHNHNTCGGSADQGTIEYIFRKRGKSNDFLEAINVAQDGI